METNTYVRPIHAALQLFVRKSEELEADEYIVCGIIKSSEILTDEAIIVLDGTVHQYLAETKFVSDVSKKNTFDKIIKLPIWRKFKSNSK